MQLLPREPLRVRPGPRPVARGPRGPGAFELRPSRRACVYISCVCAVSAKSITCNTFPSRTLGMAPRHTPVHTARTTHGRSGAITDATQSRQDSHGTYMHVHVYVHVVGYLSNSRRPAARGARCRPHSSVPTSSHTDDSRHAIANGRLRLSCRGRRPTPRAPPPPSATRWAGMSTRGCGRRTCR